MLHKIWRALKTNSNGYSRYYRGNDEMRVRRASANWKTGISEGPRFAPG